MALSGNFTGSTSNDRVQPKITWSAKQSIVNNYSDVTATLTYSRTNTGYTTSGTWSGGITINGTRKSGSKSISITYNSNTVAITVTVRVYHNADGKKNITISADGAISGTGLTSTTCKATVPLDPIPRQAVILSAPDFSDEDNPTITYSNPAGTAVAGLQACISLTGSADDIAYRDIDMSGNTYTFELSDEERDLLRNATLEGSVSRTVKFYIRTIIGTTKYYSNLSKTFTVIDCMPVISPTVKDTGYRSTILTDNPDKIIKGYNTIETVADIVLLKGASIVSSSVTCGTQRLDTTPSEAESTYASEEENINTEPKTITTTGTLENIESATFIFSVTDNRGQTVTQTVTKELIEYIKLTCGMDITAPNAEGELEFDIIGNSFNGNFGAVDNTLSVEYRYALVSADYPTNDNGDDIWIMAGTLMLSDTGYTTTVKITGLDYKSGYKVQARAADGVYYEYIYATERKVRAVPIFDWGEKDFKFNVPVTIDGYTVINDEVDTPFVNANQGYIGRLESESISLNGNSIGYNRILWSGAYYMQEDHVITLSQNISDQINGIVLVFSYYDTTNKVAMDHSFNTFFISKKQVELLSGFGHTFIMGINAGFSSIAAKYLYFSDTTISGHAGNKTSGANSGITFDNAKYVLRYVIGV